VTQLCAIPGCRQRNRHLPTCTDDCLGCLPRLAEDGTVCEQHVRWAAESLAEIIALAPDVRLVAAGLVRHGSGGGGRFHGGDGIVRELEALEPMRFTLIGERRRHAPQGREGGAVGATGRDLLNGRPIPAKGEGELRPGDRLRIETPGGGGYGSGPNS